MPSPVPDIQSQGDLDDFRCEPRVGIDLPVEVHSAELSGALPGRSRDLSVTGVCVATPSPFAFKSVSRVVLHLPGGPPMALEAEGRWQREMDGDDIVLTGIAFREPEALAGERLWEAVLARGKQLTRFLYAGSDLCGLGLDEAMGIAQVTRVRDLSTGAWIYRQDRSSDAGDDSIFVLARGRVVLQTRVRDTRDVPFETLEPGALFGGAPLVAGTPPGESAVADTDARVLEIDRNAFEYLRAAKPWLALRLAQAVIRVQGQRVQRLLARARDAL